MHAASTLMKARRKLARTQALLMAKSTHSLHTGYTLNLLDNFIRK